MDKDELIARLDLQPLEGEGGLYSRIYRDELSNAIYFMVISPDFSAWHRLPQAELWLHLSGDPLLLHTIEKGHLMTHRLEREGNTRHYRVPANTWMAAESSRSYSLVSCFLAPAFSTMELASRDELVSQYPDISDLPELFHE
ncbi:MAG: cupin domain-containing protein [Actinobacteria bacterium]|nr:cupin domain-containing protein [Actinomycetota bacterium]